MSKVKLKQIEDIASGNVLSFDDLNNVVNYDNASINDVLDNAKVLANYAALRTYNGRAKTVRISQTGIAGLFYHDTQDTSSLDDNGILIVSNSGKRWRRYLDGVFIKPEYYGAIPDDTTDSYNSILSAIKTKWPVLISGNYVSSQRFNYSGSIAIIGNGRDRSRIRWPSTATSAGFNILPTSLNDRMVYKEVEMLCETSASANVSFIFSNWSGITGYDTITNFSNKFEMDGSILRCSGNGVFQKGIELRNLFGGTINNSRIIGPGRTLFTDAASAYRCTHLLHLSNDATASNTVGFKVYDSIFNYGLTAAQFDDVEGLDWKDNDVQLCWNGLWAVNTIRKINQYRINGGHFGCSDNAIYVKNARHVNIVGSELSWGSNRANGATFSYVIMESVEDPRIVDNTVRGNGAKGTYAHTITGIQLTGISGNNTSYAIIDDNSFVALTNAVVQEANTGPAIIGISNTFDNVDNRIINNLGSGSAQNLIYGSGLHKNPSGVGPQVLFTSIQQAPFALNRSGNTGTLATWHNDNGTASGSITINSTSVSYNTTSDMTLKQDLGEFDKAESERILKDIIIRKYSWKLNNNISEGVFAQELYKVYPEAVFKGYHYLLTEEGQEFVIEEETENSFYVPWSVDYSKLVPILISGHQLVNSKLNNILERLENLEK